ncbi:MAG: aminopeptidase [Actinobacteria bacterium]|nr:aminopeptidase [Actinomycetota bacterium]MBV8395949.1 aminopeptidase [Actinomycetota bacterium]MBV8597707.1 aminopeptidase [Actinomycetota bacterium]
MRNPKVDAYARLLVGRCVDVRPGWDVLVRSTVLARPLVEAVIEEIARRGAHPLLQLSFETVGGPFAREAPLDVLREASSLQRRIWDECDAIITISAPENTREGSDLSDERRQALEMRSRPLRRRTMSMDVPWVICEYPVHATAQDAGMTLEEMEEFVFGAVLLDWDAEAERMKRIADVFDRAKEVRIVGDGTDLRLSIAGRGGIVDDGHVNMPGGEVFYSPVEDSAEGVITFSEFPAVRFGREVYGARLEFEGGQIVNAAARSGEAFLVETLDTDEGSRRLGELGIGCNPAIQRFTGSVGFDEKIGGTIHLAVGSSYTSNGGKNVSAVHWDIVKDLRRNGKLYADGELVQENGVWRV